MANKTSLHENINFLTQNKQVITTVNSDISDSFPTHTAQETSMVYSTIKNKSWFVSKLNKKKSVQIQVHLNGDQHKKLKSSIPILKLGIKCQQHPQLNMQHLSSNKYLNNRINLNKINITIIHNYHTATIYINI